MIGTRYTTKPRENSPPGDDCAGFRRANRGLLTIHEDSPIPRWLVQPVTPAKALQDQFCGTGSPPASFDFGEPSVFTEVCCGGCIPLRALIAFSNPASDAIAAAVASP